MDEKDRFEKGELSEDIKRFNEMLSVSKRIVFFGGAGVSTESGIPDFRSADGLYSDRDNRRRISPEEILSHTFFMRNTEDFYEFYRDKMLYPDAKPNITHKRLAELEAAGKEVTVVTQNIDGLHQMAGSKNVLELHGSVHRNYCMSCGQFYNVRYVGSKDDEIPKCMLCGGIIKPDVVLYEENLDSDVINKTVKAISEADMLIIAGTSLTVYPAASFIRYFRGKFTVVCNLSKQHTASNADIFFNEKVGEVFSRIDVKGCTSL